MSAILAFWILDPLYIALGTLMSWFYALSHSFGVAIILLTITVSILRMPLVSKQVKSQQAMQRVQPELKRIQTKYKADPQKRNEELMKVYKEHGVNPFAGCLPLLLQMPLFIVLYRLIMNLSAQPPKHIPENSALYHALVESGGKMLSFGMDLSESAAKVTGFADRLPYLFLIALVIGTGYYQQRQMTARLPAGGANAQFQMIGKIFPVMLGIFSYSFPAAVVLYFVISNFWQIGQQAFLFRHAPPGGAPAGGAAGGKTAGKAGGKPGGGAGLRGPNATAGSDKVIDASATETKPKGSGAGGGGQRKSNSGRTSAGSRPDSRDPKAGPPAKARAAGGSDGAKPAAPTNGLVGWFSRRTGAQAKPSANGKGGRRPTPSAGSKAPPKPRPASGRVTPPRVKGPAPSQSKSPRDRKGK